MNRREALRQTGLLAGAVALWATLPVRTWAALAPSTGWTKEEEDLLTLVGDTIVPATPDSPGAGSVGIGRFITAMTNECFGDDASDALRRGLKEIQERSRDRFSRPFADLLVAERELLLTAYEKQTAVERKGRRIDPFRHIKDLTLLGYFTSESGATQALRYNPVPGSYRGSLTISPDIRSWAL